MTTSVHFSHKTDEWPTPQIFFNSISDEFGPFNLDVAATAQNAKCKRFYDASSNGLERAWAAKNWCNPPYSQIKLWVNKARQEQLKGRLTVMLIPARTDTSYFHDGIYNQPNIEIRFIRGRLKFGTSKSSAPFPSMLVIFRPITLQ